MGPLLCEQVGDGLADASAGAGNKGNLAVEVEQVGLGHAVFLVIRRRGLCSEAGLGNDLQGHLFQQAVHVNELGETLVLGLAVVVAVVDLLNDPCQAEQAIAIVVIEVVQADAARSA